MRHGSRKAAYHSHLVRILRPVLTLQLLREITGDLHDPCHLSFGIPEGRHNQPHRYSVAIPVPVPNVPDPGSVLNRRPDFRLTGICSFRLAQQGDVLPHKLGRRVAENLSHSRIDVLDHPVGGQDLDHHRQTLDSGLEPVQLLGLSLVRLQLVDPLEQERHVAEDDTQDLLVLPRDRPLRRRRDHGDAEHGAVVPDGDGADLPHLQRHEVVPVGRIQVGIVHGPGSGCSRASYERNRQIIIEESAGRRVLHPLTTLRRYGVRNATGHQLQGLLCPP